jgi:hypothetical protein
MSMDLQAAIAPVRYHRDMRLCASLAVKSASLACAALMLALLGCGGAAGGRSTAEAAPVTPVVIEPLHDAGTPLEMPPPLVASRHEPEPQEPASRERTDSQDDPDDWIVASGVQGGAASGPGAWGQPGRTGPGSAMAPFDRGAAAHALSRVSTDLCAKHGGPTGPGHVTLTFDASGAVRHVDVDPQFRGTPAGACVAAQFAAVRVPPFTGSPVKVGKSFVVQ